MGGIRRTISLDELDHFQIDDERMLYWDGEPVITMSKFSLPWWVNGAALAVALSTVGTFVLDLLGKLHVFG
jgi:hypothetical protein